MATITITVTAAQAARVTSALGKHSSLKDADGAPRDATAAEVKEWLVRQMRALVLQQERRVAEATVTVAPFDPT